MSNLEIYNKVRAVPAEALKEIQAGRLKGMSDINPMWRIKTLTETFGVCGFGWYVDVIKKDTYTVNEEIVTSVDIHLFVKQGGEWSKPIFGTGGSKLSTQEKNGLYINDEAFKMAYTDAISVACKALGVAADVYFAKDRTKYDIPEGTPQAATTVYTPSQPKPAAIDNKDEDGKQWLNMFDKDGNLTKRGQYTIDKLKKGETTIAQIEAVAKVNKKEREYLTQFLLQPLENVMNENKDVVPF